jgi:hypothetical protein
MRFYAVAGGFLRVSVAIRETSLHLSWLPEDYVQLGEIDHPVGNRGSHGRVCGSHELRPHDTRWSIPQPECHS